MQLECFQRLLTGIAKWPASLEVLALALLFVLTKKGTTHENSYRQEDDDSSAS